jgi:hypothetical protein
MELQKIRNKRKKSKKKSIQRNGDYIKANTEQPHSSGTSISTTDGESDTKANSCKINNTDDEDDVPDLDLKLPNRTGNNCCQMQKACQIL